MAMPTPVLNLHASTDRYTASYGRVSLDEQKIGQGVKSQHEENEEFGEENNTPVNRRYEDIGISAFSGVERPGYLDLLADIAAGRIAIVIVWHADRLTRDVGEGHEFIKLCLKHNVRLFSQQRGGEYSFKRANGRADFITDINTANKESGVKSERVALARKRQARNGEFGGGKRRYGWGVETGRYRSVCLNPKADIDERVYEDRPILDMSKHRPDERDEIRHWRDEVLSGVTMNHLLRDIANRGVLTLSEKDDCPVKRNGKPVEHPKWSKATIIGILTNPRTAGHAVYRGEIVKWNAYPAIITEDERQALITLFSDPARKTSPGNTPKWLGSLLYECLMCNDGSNQRVDTSTSGELIYLCRSCGKGRQSVLLVNEYVEKVLIERLSRPDIVDLISTGPDIDIDALRTEQAVLQQRKTGAADLYSEGKIDAAQLASITAGIDRKLSKNMAELTSAVGESPLAPFALDHERAEETWRGLSLGRKREVIKTLCTVKLDKAPPRPRGPRAKKTELDTSTVHIIPKKVTE
ncbi:recombinase family protein [Streptomyces hygroscopicus]|uniref:recombinase family protein n=1 Tax=Streptomyces hygroscopicus TaxID=1912 RepID=UPI0027E2FC50|nr:recombinase family protein [Streptomyces hygroscopicus]